MASVGAFGCVAALLVKKRSPVKRRELPVGLPTRDPHGCRQLGWQQANAWPASCSSNPAPPLMTSWPSLLFFCGSLIIDEADILFDDDDFSAALRPIRLGLPPTCQIVHVTATLPADVHRQLMKEYPTALPLMGPSLHRTAIGLQEVRQ